MNREKDKQQSVPYQLPEGALSRIQANVWREVELRRKKHKIFKRTLWTSGLLAAASLAGLVFFVGSHQTDKMEKTQPATASVRKIADSPSPSVSPEKPAKESLEKEPTKKKVQAPKPESTQTEPTHSLLAASAQILTCDEEIEEGSDTEENEDLLLVSADPFLTLNDFDE